MKNKSVKYALVILLFIPIVLAVYFGITINPEQVSAGALQQVTVTDLAGEIFTFDQKQDLDFYFDITQHAVALEKPLRDLSVETPFQVTFFETKNQFTYEFYLTLNPNECLFRTASGEYFTISAQDAQPLLVREECLSLYPDNLTPVMTLSANERSYPLQPSSYDWHYRKLDGSFGANALADGGESGGTLVIPAGGTLQASFDRAPDALTVVANRGDLVVYEGNLDSMTAALIYANDTDLSLVITAEWYQLDDSPYYGKAEYTVNALYDVPASFTMVDKTLSPGEFTILHMENFNPDETITLTSELILPPEIKSYQYNGKWFALLPISYENKAGDYSIGVSTNYNSAETLTLRVKEKTFSIETITVTDDALKTKNTEESWEEYDKFITPVVAESVQEKLWDGKFIDPVTGTTTRGTILTAFGTTRFVSTITTAYRHTGIDLSAAKGTEVKATNNGKVVYAGELTLTGNTVVIDHGFGVFSYYYHMDTLNCAAGDMVDKGAKIGTAGTTGFASVSHVHYAVSIDGIYVNPVSNYTYGIEVG